MRSKSGVSGVGKGASERLTVETDRHADGGRAKVEAKEGRPSHLGPLRGE